MCYFIITVMLSNIIKLIDKEKLAAAIILFAAFVFIPYKILSSGFMPIDDGNRHVAYSVTSSTNWSEVLEIEPSLAADHNKGWHCILRALHKYLKIDKDKLLIFTVVALFLIFNITGSLIAPNIGSWTVVLILVFVFDRGLFVRMLSGRPFIISCITTLLLFKLWFVESEPQIKTISRYIYSLIILSLAVWLHGTWYTFLILPMALLLSGKLKKSIELTVIILVSTLLGAYLTGEFDQFLYFHYAATLNIFTEKLYNWQLVTEFAEGNIHNFWMIPTVIIIWFLIYSKKMTLNELSKDSLFIMVLLCWMLSIKVVRFWIDWGLIALMCWLSYKISDLINEMQTIKKPFFRRVLFLFTVISIVILVPGCKWSNQKERNYYYADFSTAKFADYKPPEGGIIYNDNMTHFYFQYYHDPEGKYKYVLGFEPAIMLNENRKVFREIIYSNFHYSSYKPWIDKLTEKDRIFTSTDISIHYPQLDWIKGGKKLWIGKLSSSKHE